MGHKNKLAPAAGLEIQRPSPAASPFALPHGWMEGARDPQSFRSGSPIQSKIGPMIPAYDFSPVGEGVTFLPKGNREGSCARSRLHDSADLECRGPVS